MLTPKLSLAPLLLRPKLLAIKNRWSRESAMNTRMRDYIILAFAALVMLGIYYGCMRALAFSKANSQIAYLHASTPLSLFFAFLLGMLTFSNLINAFGALILAKDMDLVLSAPLRRGQFYWGKFCEIFMSSSWMALVFALPAAMAFGISYKAEPSFYIAAILSAIPFFTIPSAVAITVVVIFALIIPLSRTRELLVVVCLLFLLCIWVLVQLVSPELSNGSRLNDMLRLIALVSAPSKDWLPSHWVSQLLGNLLERNGGPVTVYLAALVSLALTLLALSYAVTELFHFSAYSRSRSISQSAVTRGIFSHSQLTRLLACFRPDTRALVIKEGKTFTRDITQAIQVLLLLGICSIYLYNFTLVRTLDDIPQDSRAWWRAFLLITNLAMADFMITAACTRFVFPSISLEGPSFWVIQTTPLSIKRLMQAKFWFWFVPISLVTGGVVIAGALALKTPAPIIATNIVASSLICYGIVGLAIGLGAVFSNFEWEHASQLAASFGSLVFMLISTLLIAASIIPTIVLTFGYNAIVMRPHGHIEWGLWMLANLALLTYINIRVCRGAFAAGERSLRKRME